MADPSAFLFAAFGAGIIEGSSVLRHYAGMSNVETKNLNENSSEIIKNGNGTDGDNDGNQAEANLKVTAATASADLPSSVPLMAWSILYGAASIPLGLVGGSPGPVFVRTAIGQRRWEQMIRQQEHHLAQNGTSQSSFSLREPYSSRSKEAKQLHTSLKNNENKNNDGNHADNDAGDNVASDTSLNDVTSPQSVRFGTGRGLGRMLREENLKKKSINFQPLNMGWQNIQAPTPKGDDNSPKVFDPPNDITFGVPNHANETISVTGTAKKSSLGNKFNPSSTRSPRMSNFISTLDGNPLPTPLAEAMRRSRFLLTGAGLVAYSISLYTSRREGSEQNKILHPDSYSNPLICNNPSDYPWLPNNTIPKKHSVDYRSHLRIEEKELCERLKVNKTTTSVGSIINDAMIYFGIPTYDQALIILRNKIEILALNSAHKTIEWLQVELFGQDSSKAPLRWIKKWKEEILHNSSVFGKNYTFSSAENLRPISLRLIPDEAINQHQMVLSPSLALLDEASIATMCFPWGMNNPSDSTSSESNSNSNGNGRNLQLQTQFLVLPVFCPGHQHLYNREATSKFLHWKLGSSREEWERLPLQSSWLLKHPRSELHEESNGNDSSLGSSPPQSLSKLSSPKTIIPSFSLVIEANLAPPLAQLIQQSNPSSRRRMPSHYGSKADDNMPIKSARFPPPTTIESLRMSRRILQDIAKDRCNQDCDPSISNGDHDNVATTSILLFSKGSAQDTKEEKPKAEAARSDDVIGIDALNVLNWAILSTINGFYPGSTPNSTKGLTSGSNDTSCQNPNSGVSMRHNDQETSSSSTVTAGNDVSRTKILDAAITTVDVLGTSIRHLFVSTYKIVTAGLVVATGQKRQPSPINQSVPSQDEGGNQLQPRKTSTVSKSDIINNDHNNQQEKYAIDTNADIKKVIHVFSPIYAVAHWLKGVLFLDGWQVKWHDTGDFINTNPLLTSSLRSDRSNPFRNDDDHGGLVLVLGSNDIETCELTCAMVDQYPQFFAKSERRLVVLLEEPNKIQALNDLLKRSDNFVADNKNRTISAILRNRGQRDHVGNETDTDHYNKVNILCTAFIYEYAFAAARGCLGRGLSPKEVEISLAHIFCKSGSTTTKGQDCRK